MKPFDELPPLEFWKLLVKTARLNKNPWCPDPNHPDRKSKDSFLLNEDIELRVAGETLDGTLALDYRMDTRNREANVKIYLAAYLPEDQYGGLNAKVPSSFHRYAENQWVDLCKSIKAVAFKMGFELAYYSGLADLETDFVDDYVVLRGKLRLVSLEAF